MRIIERAPAKVNLALHVLGRRADGYHLLDSIVAFADLGDELAFEPADRFSLTIEGPFAKDLAADDTNLVLKAAHALARQWPERVAPARISLRKNLPLASGIGGGSADAAATIRGLLRMSGLDSGHETLSDLALSLGADVPVCLQGAPCRMQGIGEEIAPLVELRSYPAVLVNPGVPLGTAAVFAALALAKGTTHSAPIAEPLNPKSWRNDLEAGACALSGEIRTVLKALLGTRGLIKAGMSGSGATCYGLFDTRDAANDAASLLRHAEPTWWIESVVLN